MGDFAILYVSSRYKLSSSEVIKDIVHPTKNKYSYGTTKQHSISGGAPS